LRGPFAVVDVRRLIILRFNHCFVCCHLANVWRIAHREFNTHDAV